MLTFIVLLNRRTHSEWGVLDSFVTEANHSFERTFMDHTGAQAQVWGVTLCPDCEIWTAELRQTVGGEIPDDENGVTPVIAYGAECTCGYQIVQTVRYGKIMPGMGTALASRLDALRTSALGEDLGTEASAVLPLYSEKAADLG